jgi:hypothetical protein
LPTVRFRLVSAAACAALGVATTSRSASAYSYESAVSTGCHERITMGALRTVRTQLPTAPLVAPDRNERALIDDVPFTLDDDMKDITSVALVIGIRDNDLKGRGPTEVDQLAAIHGNPDNQREHCLRAIGDDEPDGSARALEACKAFIRGKLVEALDGLDAGGVPDPNRRVDIEVSLSLRGRVTASLPLYWVRMGQAMHTLQDGFSHTFRSPDRMRVRTVLNWIEYVNGDESESRDGPVHRNGLDACDKLDDLQTVNLGVASQASLELLRATLDPSLGRDAKLAAVDATLAKYLAYEPGCTEANGWCDAPERKYEVAASCGCATIGSRSRGLLAAGACGLGLALLVARRRRRRGAERLAALSVVVACITAPASARAQDEPPPAAAATPPGATTTDAQTGAVVAVDEKKPPPGVPTATEVKAETTEKEHRSLFGVYAAGSGSITNPGLSGQLGLRFRLTERWTLGVDGEINGWFAEQTQRFRTGALNVYATAIFHYPLRFEQVNLRSTVNLGTSTMLIDLYGAPRGTTGIFIGAVPLGLEWKVSSALYVIFDVLGVAVPIPQLVGAPFAYPQYRTALGVELAF